MTQDTPRTDSDSSAKTNREALRSRLLIGQHAGCSGLCGTPESQQVIETHPLAARRLMRLCAATEGNMDRFRDLLDQGFAKPGWSIEYRNGKAVWVHDDGRSVPVVEIPPGP